MTEQITFSSLVNRREQKYDQQSTKLKINQNIAKQNSAASWFFNISRQNTIESTPSLSLQRRIYTPMTAREGGKTTRQSPYILERKVYSQMSSREHNHLKIHKLNSAWSNAEGYYPILAEIQTPKKLGNSPKSLQLNTQRKSLDQGRLKMKKIHFEELPPAPQNHQKNNPYQRTIQTARSGSSTSRHLKINATSRINSQQSPFQFKYILIRRGTEVSQGEQQSQPFYQEGKDSNFNKLKINSKHSGQIENNKYILKRDIFHEQNLVKKMDNNEQLSCQLLEFDSPSPKIVQIKKEKLKKIEQNSSIISQLICNNKFLAHRILPQDEIY